MFLPEEENNTASPIWTTSTWKSVFLGLPLHKGTNSQAAFPYQFWVNFTICNQGKNDREIEFLITKLSTSQLAFWLHCKIVFPGHFGLNVATNDGRDLCHFWFHCIVVRPLRALFLSTLVTSHVSNKTALSHWIRSKNRERFSPSPETPSTPIQVGRVTWPGWHLALDS